MKERSSCVFKGFFNSKRIAKLRIPCGLTITKDVKLQVERISNDTYYWDCNLFFKLHHILLISIFKGWLSGIHTVSDQVFMVYLIESFSHLLASYEWRVLLVMFGIKKLSFLLKVLQVYFYHCANVFYSLMDNFKIFPRLWFNIHFTHIFAFQNQSN